MKYRLCKYDLEFIRGVIAFGEKLKTMPEATPEIMDKIRQVQEVLGKLPEVPSNIQAEYGFGVFCFDLNFHGVNRSWHVIVEPSDRGPMITVGSICCVVPDRAEHLERSIEIHCLFRPGLWPLNTPAEYEQWLAEVRDPNRWRNVEQEFEIEADHQAAPTKGQPLPSTLEVQESRDGFSIATRAWGSIRVTLEPWQFVIRSHKEFSERRIAIVQGRALADWVVAAMEALPAVRFGFREDAQQRVRVLVDSQRQRLLAQVPPAVARVQRATLRATGRVGWLARQPQIYAHAEIVTDVLRYRAAAIALAGCGVDEGSPIEGFWWPSTKGLSAWSRRDPRRLPDLRSAIADMSNWRALFSPTGATYRSLDRTLMNLPPQVVAEWLPGLRRVRLPRPILSAIELNIVLAAVCLRERDLWQGYDDEATRPFNDDPLLAVVLKASEAEICTGMSKIATHTRRRLNPLRPQDIQFFVGMLADRPGEHHGRLGGLVSKAIAWHRGLADPAETVRLLGLAEATPTRVPAVPLPEEDGIRFLANVGEIVSEALRMRHCVAHHATRAVEGWEYVFHVRHKGTDATVAISSCGWVLQACGPQNTDNHAARWGREQLKVWGEGLQKTLLDRAAAG